MYWFGLILLVLGVVLLGFTNPWQFLQAAQGSFFDWTEIFWFFQWGGLWLVCASLLVFGGIAWKAPAAYAPPWRVVPAGIALFLFVLFFVYSMPEKSNQPDWKNGWLGARTYVRTKMWRRGDDGGENAIPKRLAGRWVVPGGIAFTISPDSIRMVSHGSETVWSGRDCQYRFRMDYDFAFRSEIRRPLLPGLGFQEFDQMKAASVPLPDRRFPRLSCSCNERIASWVLLDIDQLMVLEGSARGLVAKRG